MMAQDEQWKKTTQCNVTWSHLTTETGLLSVITTLTLGEEGSFASL
jgi:hypothetical protein